MRLSIHFHPYCPMIDVIVSGIYASPAGCLQSYYANQEGIIAPTIATPSVGTTPCIRSIGISLPMNRLKRRRTDLHL